MFFLTRNIIILFGSINLQKIILMKFIFLSIAICLGITASTAQNTFQNLWKIQDNGDNQIEIKITEKSENTGLSFVLEGLMRKTSRIFITGNLELQALNQYRYQDKNTDCNITFNFVNKDSMYIESNLCDLYTLNDSINGLYTSNYDDLITPKILGEYNADIENAIALKTGDDFESIRLKSVHKIHIDTDSTSTVYMANSEDLVRTDPQVIYYIKDDSISIFYRFKDVINTYISPDYNNLSEEISAWMEKERVAPTPEKQ